MKNEEKIMVVEIAWATDACVTYRGTDCIKDGSFLSIMTPNGGTIMVNLAHTRSVYMYEVEKTPKS